MSQQYPLPLPRLESMTAADFMIADSNREAVAWLTDRDPSGWPAHCLILYGPEGCGKTHLLTIWAGKSGAQALSAGDKVIDAIVSGGAAFPALVLDDADRIAGHPEHEEWLQHLYNATQAARMPLLLAAKRAPAAWGLGLKDIESRLKSCPAIEIKGPDDALMRGMLLKQFGDRQLMVEMDVIDYLIPRLERTGTAIRQAVERLDRSALGQKRKITVPFARELLG